MASAALKLPFRNLQSVLLARATTTTTTTTSTPYNKTNISSSDHNSTDLSRCLLHPRVLEQYQPTSLLEALVLAEGLEASRTLYLQRMRPSLQQSSIQYQPDEQRAEHRALIKARDAAFLRCLATLEDGMQDLRVRQFYLVSRILVGLADEQSLGSDEPTERVAAVGRVVNVFLEVVAASLHDVSPSTYFNLFRLLDVHKAVIPKEYAGAILRACTHVDAVRTHLDVLHACVHHGLQDLAAELGPNVLERALEHMALDAEATGVSRSSSIFTANRILTAVRSNPSFVPQEQHDSVVERCAACLRDLEALKELNVSEMALCLRNVVHYFSSGVFTAEHVLAVTEMATADMESKPMHCIQNLLSVRTRRSNVELHVRATIIRAVAPILPRLDAACVVNFVTFAHFALTLPIELNEPVVARVTELVPQFTGVHVARLCKLLPNMRIPCATVIPLLARRFIALQISRGPHNDNSKALVTYGTSIVHVLYGLAATNSSNNTREMDAVKVLFGALGALPDVVLQDVFSDPRSRTERRVCANAFGDISGLVPDNVSSAMYSGRK